MPEATEATEATGAAVEAPMAGLFGRGLLYVVVAALPFVSATVVSPVLAYRLGPRQFGLMASAIALHQVLVVLGSAGLDQALVLQRAEDRHDRSARGLIAVGIVLATGVTVATGVSAPFWSRAFGFPAFDALVLATVLWTAPAVTVQLVLALLVGQDRLRAFSAVSCLSTVGSQAVGLLLLFTVTDSVAVYAWGGVVGQVAAMGVGLLAARPDWRGLADRAVVRRALSVGVPIMLSGLSAFVLNAGDRVIIQRAMGSTQAGRYQVAYTVGFIAVTVLGLTGQSWSARFAAVRAERERLALIGAARDALYRVLGPTVLGVVLAAPLLLRVLAPPSFEPATLLVVVLPVMLCGIPVIATLALSRALITARRGVPLALTTGAAAVLNVGLNLVVVPRWGLPGAAAVSLLAFTVQAVLQRACLPRGTAWPHTPPGQLVLLGVLCALAAASTAAPQDAAWIAARTAAAALCLPWALVHLRRARSLGAA